MYYLFLLIILCNLLVPLIYIYPMMFTAHRRKPFRTTRLFQSDLGNSSLDDEAHSLRETSTLMERVPFHDFVNFRINFRTNSHLLPSLFFNHSAPTFRPASIIGSPSIYFRAFFKSIITELLIDRSSCFEYLTIDSYTSNGNLMV